MEKNISLSIVAGCALIAAAIYLKPSTYDRCVDRYTSTTFSRMENQTPSLKRNILQAAINECAN